MTSCTQQHRHASVDPFLYRQSSGMAAVDQFVHLQRERRIWFRSHLSTRPTATVAFDNLLTHRLHPRALCTSFALTFDLTWYRLRHRWHR